MNNDCNFFASECSNEVDHYDLFRENADLMENFMNKDISYDLSLEEFRIDPSDTKSNSKFQHNSLDTSFCSKNIKYNFRQQYPRTEYLCVRREIRQQK